MSFSNVPGPTKPFLYSGENGGKIRTIQSATYIITPGLIGFTLACMTFSNSFKIAVSADDNVVHSDEVMEFSEMVYEKIVE